MLPEKREKTTLRSVALKLSAQEVQCAPFGDVKFRFPNFKTGGFVFGSTHLKILGEKLWKREARHSELSRSSSIPMTISKSSRARKFGADFQNIFLAERDGAEQAAQENVREFVSTRVNSSGRSSIAACTNKTLGKPPFLRVAFIEIFSSGFTFGSIPMKNLFGFFRADADTKRPSPVPMSITMPSPVRFDKLLEFTVVELSNGTATNLRDHNSRL